jgi:peptide/nickel transport system substrate-binding protein
VPPRHPAALEAGGQSYNPSAASAQLRELGWWDEDLDGIREAHDVPDTTDGQPLGLTLHFASEYITPAAYVAADLEECGFDIELRPTDRRQLYAVDAASPLFGRRFELALVGWQVLVPEICGAWFSHRIPTEENNWLGENFSGFASEAYDAACEEAFSAVTVEQERQALQAAQDLLDETLPTILLAWRPFWFAAKPEVQGLEPDASTYGTIWNAEVISIAPSTLE